MSCRLLCAILFLIAASCISDTDGRREGAQSQDREIERATSDLATKTFKKVGIRASLPRDVIQLSVERDRQWQEIYGCVTIGFVLSRVSMAQYNRGDLNPIAGHINVYSPEQYDQWIEAPGEILEGGELVLSNGKASWSKDDEQFDKLLVYEGQENEWGLTQTTYRLDRKASDGRVLQAMITRMDYTEDLTARQEDTTLITNILESVQFIEDE